MTRMIVFLLLALVLAVLFLLNRRHARPANYWVHDIGEQIPATKSEGELWRRYYDYD